MSVFTGAVQLGTHFLHHADGGKDLLCKGDKQTTEQAEEALCTLAGIVALDRHTHLHNAPAKDDNTDGPDAGKDKGGQVVYNGQRIGGRGKGLGRQQAAHKDNQCPHTHQTASLCPVILGIVFGKFLH